jgi:hypothetical protein
MVLGGPIRQSSFEDEVRRLGMEPEALRAAIGHGNQERRRVLGRHNAISAQGFYAWNGVLAKLSETFEEVGWQRRDPLCLPVLMHGSRKNLLFVSSGDSYTGVRVPKNPPKSRNPKGNLVRRLAAQNRNLNQADTLPLSLPQPEEQELIAELIGYTSYVLLVYFAREECEVRYEVSELDVLDSRGRLSLNAARFIAAPYPLHESDFDDGDPNNGFDGADDFDVPEKS